MWCAFHFTIHLSTTILYYTLLLSSIIRKKNRKKKNYICDICEFAYWIEKKKFFLESSCGQPIQLRIIILIQFKNKLLNKILWKSKCFIIFDFNLNLKWKKNDKLNFHRFNCQLIDGVIFNDYVFHSKEFVMRLPKNLLEFMKYSRIVIW